MQTALMQTDSTHVDR